MDADKRTRKLLAELTADLAAWRRHRGRWRGALDGSAPWTPEHPDLFRAAVALHHGYAAMEGGFERIARGFEGLPDPGPRWHQELLAAMALPIPELRPSVLTPPSLAALRDALAFRHFFRHAYAVDLDPVRVRRVASDLEAAADTIEADLDSFIGTLTASLTAPRSSEA